MTIVEERPQTKIYTRIGDWKKAHPDSPAIASSLIQLTIKVHGSYVEELSPIEGEYTWGDYTEFKFWDSPFEFAREHTLSYSLVRIQERFVADLAEKMASRFDQGYLTEVLGLRDKAGKDISLAMPYVKFPKSVYHVEMERREEERRLIQETSSFLRGIDEAYEATKKSDLVFRRNIC